MGCGCRKNQTLDNIRRLAKLFSKSSKQDIQIFKLNSYNNLYNFEPYNINRNNVIEIIKWEEE